MYYFKLFSLITRGVQSSVSESLQAVFIQRQSDLLRYNHCTRLPGPFQTSSFKHYCMVMHLSSFWWSERDWPKLIILVDAAFKPSLITQSDFTILFFLFFSYPCVYISKRSCLYLFFIYGIILFTNSQIHNDFPWLFLRKLQSIHSMSWKKVFHLC